MKRQKLTRLSLLAVAMSLLTGCYGGWESYGSQMSSVQSESSEISSSEEPEPVEWEGVDLTYDFDGGNINPISRERFKQILEENTGSPNAYESVCDVIQPYLLDYFLTHNHFTDEEFVKTFAMSSTIVSFITNGGYCTYSDAYSLAYYIASINTDHFLATIKEVWNDPLARAYLLGLFQYSNMFGYITADEYFNGENEQVNEMARQERLLLTQTPEFANSSITEYSWLDTFNVENAEVLFRFLRRLSRCLVINLKEIEVGYLFANIMRRPLIDGDKVLTEINEDMPGFVHRAGKALSMFDVSATSYQALYPFFIRVISNAVSAADDEAPFDYTFTNRVKVYFTNFFKTLDPKGLRVVVKFFGMCGENASEDLLESLQHNIAEDWPGDEPIYQNLVDLYNEQFGLLEADEKTSVKAAFNSFGIDFDLLIDSLEDVLTSADTENMGENLEEVTEHLIRDQVQRKFSFGSRKVQAIKNDAKLVLKQGEKYSSTDFEKYLRGFNQWKLQYNEEGNWRDEVNGRNRDRIKLSNSFETDTCGLKYIIFSLETSFVNVGSEDVKLIMPYYVVSKDLTFIPPFINSELRYNGGTKLDKGRYYYDESNNPIATLIHDTPILLQNQSYSEDLTGNFEISGGYIYDEDFKMFIRISESGLLSNFYNTTHGSVKISTLDTSTTGVHYGLSTLTINEYDEPITTIPLYFRYRVVSTMPTFDTGSASTPIVK